MHLAAPLTTRLMRLHRWLAGCCRRIAAVAHIRRQHSTQRRRWGRRRRRGGWRRDCRRRRHTGDRPDRHSGSRVRRAAHRGRRAVAWAAAAAAAVPGRVLPHVWRRAARGWWRGRLPAFSALGGLGSDASAAFSFSPFLATRCARVVGSGARFFYDAIHRYTLVSTKITAFGAGNQISERNLGTRRISAHTTVQIKTNRNISGSD